jgi:uncharacterized radical SAM superfamily Fe-S cluster-containing enzyme
MAFVESLHTSLDLSIALSAIFVVGYALYAYVDFREKKLKKIIFFVTMAYLFSGLSQAATAISDQVYRSSNETWIIIQYIMYMFAIIFAIISSFVIYDISRRYKIVTRWKPKR